MTEIVWAPAADRDLGRQKAYLDRVSRSASSKLFRKVLEACELLEQQPEMGRFIDGLQPARTYRAIVIDHYMLIYRWEPPRLRILRFWDARQNPTSLTISAEE